MKSKKPKYILKDHSGKQAYGGNYMDGWVADYEIIDKTTSIIVAAFTQKEHAELFFKALTEKH